MKSSAKIHYLHPAADANATHDRMLPDDITEAMIEESRQRAREMVFAMVVFGFAIIGAAWVMGYLVGMVTG